MIKRQFYALEHRSHGDEASASSSSSSEEKDEISASSRPEEEEEEEEEAEVSSPASSEDKFHGSADEEDENVAKVSDEDDDRDSPKRVSKQTFQNRQLIPKSKLSNQWADAVEETINDRVVDFSEEFVIVCKNVLKCRLCPKTICLSGETMQVHLSSKKHRRSVKQLNEGKLKVILNSDGEEEEQGETHAERYARIIAFSKQETDPGAVKRKRNSGRQRQCKRAKWKGLLAKKEESTTHNNHEVKKKCKPSKKAKQRNV